MEGGKEKVEREGVRENLKGGRELCTFTVMYNLPWPLVYTSSRTMNVRLTKQSITYLC